MERVLKILTIVGARPQFIKAAVIHLAIGAHNESGRQPRLAAEIVHTGQHYDHEMSQVFFDQMSLTAPAINLGLGNGSHGVMTGRMLAALEREIQLREPDWVLVYGDTNSTLAGALAAAKLRVPVAHVEAGLRSDNKGMPEEINRICADHVSSLLLCPTEQAVHNLAREGLTGNVHLVGDVMYDAALLFRDQARPPRIEGPFALATIHRAENTDDPRRLGSILEALAACPIPVILTLHPRTKQVLIRNSWSIKGAITLVDPLPYLEMLGHIGCCRFVLTDSGGLQKEAFFFGKRCVTLREETEWVELVEIGANKLAGADPGTIGRAMAWAMEPFTAPARLYGDGQAGAKIVRLLAQGPKTLATQAASRGSD